MTIDEIFANLNKHAIEGLMFHAQLADYYDFLGLKGFHKCHEYHYHCENCNFRKLNNYYIHHHGKLIEEMRAEDPQIIPQAWFGHKRSEVSIATKKGAIQVGIEKWVGWERKTKKLYESMYNELIQLGEIASAMMVEELIKDVDKELADAEQKWIERSSIDYNVNDIMLEQENIEKKYKKKLKEIELC